MAVPNGPRIGRLPPGVWTPVGRFAKALVVNGKLIKIQIDWALVRQSEQMCAVVAKVLNKPLSDFHVHHWLFKCLNGSEAAANKIGMQAILHVGRKIGLHRHLNWHMKGLKFGNVTVRGARFKELVKAYDDIVKYGTAAQLTAFKEELYHGYQTFFAGCQGEAQILDCVRTALGI